MLENHFISFCIIFLANAALSVDVILAHHCQNIHGCSNFNLHWSAAIFKFFELFTSVIKSHSFSQAFADLYQATPPKIHHIHAPIAVSLAEASSHLEAIDQTCVLAHQATAHAQAPATHHNNLLPIAAPPFLAIESPAHHIGAVNAVVAANFPAHLCIPACLLS